MNLQQKLKFYRLNTSEYELICEKLGREPEGVEWALFSALWSEHCSYKSSRVHLKKFYNQSERVLESFGENAGVIDCGEGERIAFKMESHNHPSYIEPYQGAATGVGGILRDIFTMGARPIALANYLCFGEPQAERMNYLVDGVVRGIGGYGNCVGVPTVTGQTEFDASYNGNILVNAMAVGLFSPGEKIFTSKAAGPGNYVVYVGAKTGRDGVHGASMASESFDEDSESKKPTIQIGDPFFEKLLIESCIEVMAENLVVAIQDMGAAGLTSSSFEMASKGGVGFQLHLDKVPIRDSSISPEEILLSESQERMLLICEPEKMAQLRNVFKKWDLDAEVIGEVIEEKKIKLYWHDEMIVDIDPDLLVENAPQHQRPYHQWQPIHRVTQSEELLCDIQNANNELLTILKDYRGTSREWVYKQYDQRVGGKTARDCSDSVAILHLPAKDRALALTLGCRPFMMRFDAREGAKDAVIYPALEMAAKGFEALAVTDCLNFGNPEKPELMSEFVASVEAMSEACEALKTPVISGNVSLYNETLDKNVTSTPSTGLVGLRNSLQDIPSSHFTYVGDKIYLLRSQMLQTSGCVAELKGREVQGLGAIDSQQSSEFVDLVRKMSELKSVRSTKLVGKFGIAYALAKMTLGGLGCKVNQGSWLLEESKPQASLFTENNYEVLFAVNSEEADAFTQLWSSLGDENRKDQLWRIGDVGGDRLHVEDCIDISVEAIESTYKNGWSENFENLA